MNYYTTLGLTWWLRTHRLEMSTRRDKPSTKTHRKEVKWTPQSSSQISTSSLPAAFLRCAATGSPK
nr:MAG TPA: hypothetical protein [Caudoviricetes sp.]